MRRDDPETVIAKLASPETKIVSLTITEGGYNFSATTGEFDLSNPAVAADLEPDAVPRTTFGLVTAALARRRDRGLPSFTVMSCDNIEANGHIARDTFTSFARHKDSRAGRLDRPEHLLSELDGRPDHPGDHAGADR